MMMIKNSYKSNKLKKCKSNFQTNITNKKEDCNKLSLEARKQTRASESLKLTSTNQLNVSHRNKYKRKSATSYPQRRENKRELLKVSK